MARMSLEHVTLRVDGMTCPACEDRIATALLRVEGVRGAVASLQGGRVEVDYEGSLVDVPRLKAAIEGSGYAIRGKGAAGTTLALGIGLLLIAAYLVAGSKGLFNALPRVDASIGYAMLFVVGLLTSIHCVAMCGGIAIAQGLGSGPEGKASEAGSRFERLRPGLLYNGGRMLSYAVIGGIAGAIGSAFSFSPTVKGIIAAAAGLFMVVLGLRMLGLIKGLPSPSGLLPPGLRGAGNRLAARFRGRGPFAVGLLNGLMPCGPLQTMQLYALGTGSFIAGAASMLIFSAGTVPLMLLFGATAALLPRKFVPVMVKASAVLVMFLGVVTFARAAALAGVALPEPPKLAAAALSPASPASPSSPGARPAPSQAGSLAAPASPIAAPAQASVQKAIVDGGVQRITTEFKDGYYVPFTVQAGLPLKWTIRVTADELNGCNNPLTVPSYGIRKELVPGDNLVEFTPKQAGRIGYTCWMGMIRSTITVVDRLSANDEAPPRTADLLAEGLGLQPAGGSCCSTAAAPAFAGGKVPTETIGMPVIKDGVQVVTVTVTAQGYSPAAIVLQKGIKAVIRFRPEALTSCNNPVVFPEYNGALDLSKGQLETPPLPVSGDFGFQCWMGMLHGYVKVVDDLSKVDTGRLRAEIAAYRAPAAGGCCGAGTAGSAAGNGK
jgi:sulfite exporter TauE/SafE/plastocyanin domain-containing protein/copper chaperone CopZ